MSGFKLADHQVVALEVMNANPHLGLFYDTGTGKTIIALEWMLQALRDGRINSALVVCPAALVNNWKLAMERITEFEGHTEADVKYLQARVKVVSFQKVYNIVKTPVNHRDGTVTYKRSLSLRPNVDRKWGAVFIDESHRIGNHDAIQTKACMTLAKLAKYRYILTGTPVTGGGGKEDFQKLFGQMNFLHPGTFPTWKAFCKEMVVGFDFWGKPKHYEVQKCRAMMQQNAIVARIEDCYDMPEVTETEMPCQLVEKKVYQDLKDGDFMKYGIDFETAGAQAVKMLQVCSGSMKRTKDVLTFKTSKDEVLREILEGTTDKVVVFCRFAASISRVSKMGLECGRVVTIQDGKHPPDNWQRFQYGDADLIVCQYASAGEGIDLFKSHTMVFYEPTLSSRELKQARARVYRKGQTCTCNMIYLVTPKTVEQKVLDTIRSGVDVTEDMLRRWAEGEQF